MHEYISSINLYAIGVYIVVIVLGYWAIRQRDLKWRYKQKEMARRR